MKRNRKVNKSFQIFKVQGSCRCCSAGTEKMKKKSKTKTKKKKQEIVRSL